MSSNYELATVEAMPTSLGGVAFHEGARHHIHLVVVDSPQLRESRTDVVAEICALRARSTLA